MHVIIKVFNDLPIIIVEQIVLFADGSILNAVCECFFVISTSLGSSLRSYCVDELSYDSFVTCFHILVIENIFPDGVIINNFVKLFAK